MSNTCYSPPKACSNTLIHIYSSIKMTMIHVPKLVLTHRKLLRSADGRVVLQVEASLDAETKKAWYVMLSRAQTCAREPVSTDGEKKCVQFAEAFALIFNILDEWRTWAYGCLLSGLSVSVLSDTFTLSNWWLRMCLLSCEEYSGLLWES
jgi:hypothetical protein